MTLEKERIVVSRVIDIGRLLLSRMQSIKLVSICYHLSQTVAEQI